MQEYDQPATLKITITRARRTGYTCQVEDDPAVDCACSTAPEANDWFCTRFMERFKDVPFRANILPPVQVQMPPHQPAKQSPADVITEVERFPHVATGPAGPEDPGLVGRIRGRMNGALSILLVGCLIAGSGILRA